MPEADTTELRRLLAIPSRDSGYGVNAQLLAAIPALLDEIDRLRGTAPQVPAEVLWEGETTGPSTATWSRIPSMVAVTVPPRTRVRVVAGDGAPQEAQSDG